MSVSSQCQQSNWLNSGSPSVREEETTSRHISGPLPSWSWPLISRPALHNHWKAEFIITAHPILCVCVLTVRRLAGLIAVGRVKRQLFVSLLWKPLAESFQSLKQFCCSVVDQINYSTEMRLVWMSELYARGTRSSKALPARQFSRATEILSRAIQCEHLRTLPILSYRFLTKQKWVSHHVPVEIFQRANTKSHLTF